MLRRRTLLKSVSNTRMLLHFDGNVVDSSPYALTMSGISNSFATGKFGQCSSISDAYASHAYEESGAFANMHNLLGDYTIDFWYDFSSHTVGNTYFVMYFGNSGASSILMININRPTTSGTFIIGAYRDAGTIIVQTTKEGVANWCHVCLQKANGMIYMYLNGYLIGSESFAYANSTFDPAVKVATYLGYNSTAFNSKLDEFRMSEGLMFNLSGFTPPTAPY